MPIIHTVVHWPTPYEYEVRSWSEVERQKQIIQKLLRRKPSEPPLEQHPIFDVLPEIPNMVVEAVEHGASKLLKDKEAEEFIVTIKASGEIVGDKEDCRLNLDTKINTTVKSKLYEETDSTMVPLDPITGNMIPRSEAYKATPLGRFIDDDPDGPPDAVIYPDEAA